MAGPIKISVLADTRDLARAMPRAESAIESLGDTAQRESNRVGSAFEAVGEGADGVASASSQAAGGLGDLGGALSLLPGPLGGLGAGMEALGPALMGATGAADLLNLVTTRFPGLAGLASGAARGLGGAVRFATGPVGLIVLGLTALGAVLVLAYKKSTTFRNIVNGAFSAVKGGAEALWTGLKAVFKKLTSLFLNFTGPGQLIKHWDKIKSAGVGAFNGIKDGARTAFNGVAGFWNATVGKISFSVPDWVPGMGGKGWSIPNIPLMDTGGVVKGPGLVAVGPGITEAFVMSRSGHGVGALGGDTYVVNLNGTFVGTTQSEVGRWVAEALDSYGRSGGRRRAG